MEKVIFIIFSVIFFANDALLMSHGMSGDSLKTDDGNKMQPVTRTLEVLATQNAKKVERRMPNFEIVQNYSESHLFINNENQLGKEAYDRDDKDYSEDVRTGSAVSSTVLLEWNMTMTPLTANEQYITGGQKTGAYNEDRVTLKPLERDEISGDSHSDVVTDFEFSGSLQLETSADSEHSGDLSEGSAFESSVSENSGVEDYYFVPGLKGFGNDLELDLRESSTKQELRSQRHNKGETQVSKSKFSTAEELLDLQDSKSTLSERRGLNVSTSVLPQQRSKNSSKVEVNSYVVPEDVGTIPPRFLGSGGIPTKFNGFQRATLSTVNGVGKGDENKKGTAEFLSISSASKLRSYYAPTVPVTLRSAIMSSAPYKGTRMPVILPSRRISSSVAKPGNREASKVHSTVASTFSRDIDDGTILLRLNEVVWNAVPDKILQDLYLQSIDKTSQKIRGHSKVPDRRAATVFRKIPTYSPGHHGLDESKSKTDFGSTSSPKLKISTKVSVSQDGVETLLNSTANEPVAWLSYPYQKLLLICSAIFIMLLGVAAIAVISIRGHCHAEKCCTTTDSCVEESRCEESSIPLSDIMIHRRTTTI